MEESELPERLFAAGHEPNGVRVTAYHKTRYLENIIDALGEEEVEILRRSSFGKIISLAEKPTFSGRFVRHIITRQLKVSKKHEIWILFAGKLVRFSLREFAIVTGLPCGKVPKASKKKMKNIIKETSYWPSLFGKVQSITVDCVIRLLRRKTVRDRETRIKYACLALTASVLVASNHIPHIVHEHAELIADIEEFFSYPWGRVAFDFITMASIKGRDPIALSQETVAIKGFIYALQLVMVEAVPDLLEGGQGEPLSSSESEGEDEAVSEKDLEKNDERDGEKERRKGKPVLSPGHARTLDKIGKPTVVSFINAEDFELDESILVWSEDEEDVKVDKLAELEGGDFCFKGDMFIGGITSQGLEQLKKEKKEKKEKEKEEREKNGKKKGTRKGTHAASERGARKDAGAEREGITQSVVNHDLENLTSMFADKVKDMFGHLEAKVNISIGRIDEMQSSIYLLETRMSQLIELKFKKLEEDLKASQTDRVPVVQPAAEEIETTVCHGAHAAADKTTVPNGPATSLTHPQTAEPVNISNREPTADMVPDCTKVVEPSAEGMGLNGRARTDGGSCNDDMAEMGGSNATADHTPSFSLGLSQEDIVGGGGGRRREC